MSLITEVAERELLRRKQLNALDAVIGAWNDEDHPELKEGSADWVRKLRQETEQRFRKVTR